VMQAGRGKATRMPLRYAEDTCLSGPDCNSCSHGRQETVGCTISIEEALPPSFAGLGTRSNATDISSSIPY
jgi:hypothetical protein